MNRIDVLRRNYERICSLPWDQRLAGPQRVWLAVYDAADERKLRRRIHLFQEATERSGHIWRTVDLTDNFAVWFCDAYSDYAESYFKSPYHLEAAALSEFKNAVAQVLTETLQEGDTAENTVVALIGTAGLFGFVRVSEVLTLVEDAIRGRLLVFFPGVYENNNYRLLDARDGWNYHAVPITATDAESHR